MHHKLSMSFIAAFCAFSIAAGTEDAPAGSAAQAGAAAARHFGAADAVHRGGTIRKVRDCKRRRFYNPGVFLDGGLEYLDPNYGGINHGECLDPPDQRAAPRRLSCRSVREILRDHGYRRIRSYDCKGKVYGFHADRGSRRYKLRVRSRTGRIASRTRL